MIGTLELEQVELASGPLEFFKTGTGAPLIYLHSACRARISGPLEKLAESHTVYVPVVPGFIGIARVDGIDTVQAIAEHIARFVEYVTDGHGTVDVIGHSFGGWIALRLALVVPDRIGQLVLEAPAGLHSIESSPGGAPTPRADDDRPAELIASNRAAFQAYKAASAGPDGVDQELVDRLPEIQAWTLVVIGTKDPVVPASTGQLLKRGLPHTYLMYVYEAGHNIELDQPERFDRTVREFLKRGEAFIINFGDNAD